MPKISVIIPVYGVEKYLRECLDSVLNQSLKDLEIILIDDGGKDNCPQIIDEYAKKDDRIIAIHKPNGGYGQTCNVGLEKATGEYVAIVEPDDYIDSKMYEDLYNIAKKYDSDIVKSCFYDNLQSPQETKISKPDWRYFIPEDKSFTIKEYPYFLYYHPSIWSCIYKREFLNKHNIRFVEAPGSGWTDNPFQVQTMCLAERINYTSNAYYYWRRLNKDASDDLKDYTLPFKRSDEIHEWLEKNNICDEKILANLYSRELAYIRIVLDKAGLSKAQVREASSLVQKMLDRINPNLLTKEQDKELFNIFRNNPLGYRRKVLFKKAKQRLISVRLNRHEKRVVLFGKTILKGA